VPVLQSNTAVREAWEGGSVATGRADGFSDIDLSVVAETVHHEAVLDAFERALGETVSIAHAWRVDPSSWVGITQRIYLLHDAPPYFAVDCALITPAASPSFLERERHGEPRVLFDREGAIFAPALDRVAHAARMQKRLAQIRAAWPVYRTIVAKELARGRALDAIGFYFNGPLRPGIELLGVRHRPDRYDYGWRYLHADLPPDAQRELERLAYVDSPESLRVNLANVDRLADALFGVLAAAPASAEPEFSAPSPGSPPP
jgi:hypothetical protein